MVSNPELPLHCSIPLSHHASFKIDVVTCVSGSSYERNGPLNMKIPFAYRVRGMLSTVLKRAPLTVC